ncbi:class I SAM-dependent methyltransferase [Aquimarina sp. 2-A2]|uniref:class I SAM-dependent methyltransferase n=1 Tax=Aquimarina sp. 2-A2 TaxID=3382644 RepID=UPI00387F2DCC
MTDEKLKPVYIECKDYTVSGEKFELLYNTKYDSLETHPRPTLEDLPNYYQSEDYISHTDAKRNFFEKLYQAIKNYMLQKKVNLINQRVSVKGRLLDIGAGTGDFLIAANKEGWSTYGVEPNIEARNIALTKNINLVDELSNLPVQKYDVITLWHVLEHIPDLDATFNQIQKYLDTNGILIIAVPNYKSYDATYYKEFWAAYDVPRHLWHFSKKSIKNISKEYGFELVSIKPMIFDSFYVSLLSEKYKSGKMNFLKGFYIGLLSNLKAMRSKEFSSHIYILKKA